MPALGADMEAGTLVRWLVSPGQTVQRGDIVARVETDKADIEVEIFEAGVIGELLVPEGEKVPVGTVLATLKPLPGAARKPEAAPAAPALSSAEPPQRPSAAPAPRATPAAVRIAEERQVKLDRVEGTGPGGRITRADVERVAAAAPAPGVRASPRARRLAHERGVDLAALHGSGPGGAVTVADVERAPATPAPRAAPPAAGGPEPPATPAADRALARRRAIAAAMERANREIPHYYLGATVDMSTALTWLEHENAGRPVAERILYSALLLKAVAVACHEVPEMNGYWLDGAFRRAEEVHLGVAISLREGGLVAPAIHDAHRLSVADLMAALRDLVGRARVGVLRSSEMSDPTITVTNLGEQGVETVFPVIFPPQVAIAGFGRIVERPWAVNGMLGVRPIIQCSLAADHRASDGHRGGRFLAAIERILQEPSKL